MGCLWRRASGRELALVVGGGLRPAADVADACLVRLARFFIGVDSDWGPLFLMMLNYTGLARTIVLPMNPCRNFLRGCLMMVMLITMSARG